MASKSDAESYSAQTSPFAHQPLQPGHIRLLRVVWVTEPSLQHVFPWMSPARTLQLETFCTELGEDVRKYEAVSYVWGTANASTKVICNDTTLLITSTVYEMLEFLEPRRGHLWIDAICIDQQNSEEKATQIPLMHQVYSQATRVIIWLGASNSFITSFMHDFPSAYRLVKIWKFSDPSHKYNQMFEALPPEDDAFWPGLLEIGCHPWFERLWTFQEVALAKDAHIIHGRSWIKLRRLLSFWRRLSEDYTLSLEDIVNTPPDFERSTDAFENACLVFAWRRGFERGAAMDAKDLPGLLYHIRHRKAKEQVDRIWAITGILPERLRHRISAAVDYSELGRSQYWLSYILFATAVYEEEQSLSLLELPPSTQTDSTHLPSWCPDFHITEELCHLMNHKPWTRSVMSTNELRPWYSIDKGNESEDARPCQETRSAILDHPMKSIKVQNSTTTLYTRGFIVDTIKDVVDGTGLMRPKWLDDSFDVGRIEPIQNFFINSLNLAQRTMFRSGVTSTSIPQEFVMSVFRDCRLNMQANRACEDFFTILIPDLTEALVESDDERRVAAMSFWEVARMVIGHSFFATQHGRFGMAAPGCKPGDKVCVFYGGEPLYVLPHEGTGAGSKPVVFGGTAFIPHLMDQDQRDAARVSEDEIFAMC